MGIAGMRCWVEMIIAVVWIFPFVSYSQAMVEKEYYLIRMVFQNFIGNVRIRNGVQSSLLLIKLDHSRLEDDLFQDNQFLRRV